MNIVETNLSFTNLSNRRSTNRIVIHHAAATTADAKTIHGWHKNRGWSGIGYHFVVRKNGVIERGRPINMVGAHCTGKNSDSIGICFEGNFETETMSNAQIEAGKDLLSYLYKMYGLNKNNVQRHKDLLATSCPGKNFPFDAIVNVTKTNTNPIKTNTTSKPATSTSSVYSKTQFIKDVQSAIGAKVDGIAGSETLSKTVTVSKTKNRKHNVVKPLQKYFNALGYNCGEVDGIAGVKFDSACRAFQKKHNCIVDGEITAGKNTWRSLLGLR